jgi:hypothetical protein
MDELDLQIKAFDATDFNSVDEILISLRAMMHGHYKVATMLFPPLMIYRARRSECCPTWNSVSDLSYPKGGSDSDQRASRKGIEIFYGASNYNLALSEVRPKRGDYVVLSEWEITAPFLVQVVGMDGIADPYRPTDERDSKITEFLRRNFYRRKGSLWSIAVSEFYLDGIDYDRVSPAQRPPATPDAFQGLKYPSALAPTLGYNFAVRGSFVDSSMRITRADLIYIDSNKTGGAIRHASKFVDGTIAWDQTN